MKNKKWLTYTLGTLLTLLVLAVVAGISFRIGMTQNPAFAHPAFARGFNGAPPAMPRNFQNNDDSQRMQGNFRGNNWAPMQDNPQDQGFFNRSNDRGGNHRGGKMPFIFPFIFGLAHFVVLAVVLGLILWVVYILVKKSGWRLARVEATPASVPITNTEEEVGKKKTSK